MAKLSDKKFSAIAHVKSANVDTRASNKDIRTVLNPSALYEEIFDLIAQVGGQDNSWVSGAIAAMNSAISNTWTNIVPSDDIFIESDEFVGPGGMKYHMLADGGWAPNHPDGPKVFYQVILGFVGGQDWAILYSAKSPQEFSIHDAIENIKNHYAEGGGKPYHQAQVGGPNMLAPSEDVPEVDPSDINLISERWPDQEVLWQTKQLKSQGMPYRKVLEQLIGMGVLGTDRPMTEDMDYLDSVYKQAQIDERELEELEKMEKERPKDVIPKDKELDAPQAPAQKDVKELVKPGISQEEARHIAMSFLAFVHQLQLQHTAMYKKYEEATRTRGTVTTDVIGPDGKPKKLYMPFTEADKKHIKMKLGDIQHKIERAGNLYMKLVKILGDKAPSGEDVEWLKAQVARMAPREPVASNGNDPAGTAASPIDGQRDTLSSPEIDGTGKIGQMDPAAPAMDMPQEMPAEERSLVEVVDTVQMDVNELKTRLEQGETLMPEAPPEDAGSLPSPPSKIAVDAPAKAYYEDYFGEYGHELVQDKVAEYVDIAFDLADSMGIEISTDKAASIAAYMSTPVNTTDEAYSMLSVHASANPSFATIVDTLAIEYILRNAVDTDATMAIAKPSIVTAAVLASPMAKQINAYIVQADKMNLPKVHGQSDDAVELAKMDDKAMDKDFKLAPPPHLPMCVDEKVMEGAYLKLQISWDADSDAAKGRSAKGIEQMIRSFVKGLESTKEFLDYGFLGQINVKDMDLDAGVASVFFRTDKPADAPKKVV